MKRGVKRALVGVGAGVLLLFGAAAIVPPLLWGDHTDYSHVTSIEKDRVYQDRALLEQAFALPVASAYRRGGIDFQGNKSFCGPTTAVDVAHSLGVSADQAHILDGAGVRTVFGVVPGGLTLDQEAELLRKKLGRQVTVLRDLDLATFREELKHANDPDRRYTINFTRGPLFARGGGHHSPLGAYLADQDLVLVLDVNGDYKPWLTSSERLFRALDTVDRQSGKKRGLLRIE
jgi:hypothetical protein